MHYAFVDLHSKTFYVYHTFSDTAKFFGKSVLHDHDFEISWNFYTYKDIPVTESPQNMPDTTIDGIIHKRVKLINTINAEGNKWDRITIAYFRCDKRGTMFQYDKHLSEKMGCPMVRADVLPSPYSKFNFPSVQINFIADNLTPEELKIFDAWERNAKRNTVK